MIPSGFSVDSLHQHCAPLLKRCTFPPSQTPVHCAVSGGPDSTALALLAVAAGCDTTLHHVDHGLRPDVEAEAQAVAELAEGLGAAFVAYRVTVEDGSNLEERLRHARFDVLPAGVATGHTADDRAETVLLNMMRGSGRRGLSPLSPSARHPIANLRRAETHALCGDLGLTVLHDPMNEDPLFRRVRVRSEVLPLLNDVAERDVVDLLCRQADVLGEESRLLDTLAAELDPTDAKELAAAPPPLAMRALQRWIHQTWSEGLGSAGHPHPPARRTLERALGVACGDAVATDLEHGWRMSRTSQILTLQPPAGVRSARVSDA